MSTIMELSERVIQVRSTAKHEKDYPSFTQDDIVFLFGDVIRPVGLVLNNSESESDTESPVPTAQRRSARSTKGIPPVCYGQVQIKSTIISELQKPTRYRQVLYVPCYQ